MQSLTKTGKRHWYLCAVILKVIREILRNAFLLCYHVGCHVPIRHSISSSQYSAFENLLFSVQPAVLHENTPTYNVRASVTHTDSCHQSPLDECGCRTRLKHKNKLVIRKIFQATCSREDPLYTCILFPLCTNLTALKLSDAECL